MSSNVNTGVEEREQWRARILRALDELRDDDIVHAHRGDDDRDDGVTHD